jgi:excisionase family DNA binding protein
MKQDNYIHFPMLTVGEAAKYLGVGRKMIYQLIEFGQIMWRTWNRRRFYGSMGNGMS